MDSILPLVNIALLLAAGLLVGRGSFLRRQHLLSRMSSICLHALLLFMGLRIGESDAVKGALGTIGLAAAACALLSVAGTAAVVALFSIVWRRTAAPVAVGAPPSSLPQRGAERAAGRPFANLRDPARLFAVVLAGFAVGYYLRVVPQSMSAQLSTWMLYLLIFLIGMQLPRSGVDIRSELLTWRTLLVPAGAILGSLLGGLALGPLLSLSTGKALALAAGFGWYSLSGVLITNMGDPVLGSAAFLANMLREGIALLTIPLLGRLRLSEIAIGVAGATSMDVTLPLIGRSCGPELVPLALTNGAALSLLVPVLVPLLFHL